jgi:ElaB/YqjD/DUF883 family membrane-anchored ribosome-binding protein
MVSRELKALQDQVAQRQRLASPAPAASAPSPSATAAPATATPDAEEKKLREEIDDFLKEASGLFEEAEKNIAAHPTASVIGALVVGILIGRMLARR